jgi:hypothetical protein
MKSRYLYLAAAVAFLVGAAVEAPRSVTAAVLDGIAGAIFLLLGVLPRKRT